MIIDISGLDASISSTGICFAKCCFKEEYKDIVSRILLGEEKDDELISKFSEIFMIVFSDEIKEIKETKKLLAKARKNIRENNPPSRIDIIDVERFCIERLTHQSRNIFNYIKEYAPVIVTMEDYSYSSQGSIVQMAELKGALKSDLSNYTTIWEDFDYINIPIKSVKKIVGMNGNANKEMIFHNIQRFGIDVNEKEDDRNDAISLCLSTFYAIYYRLFGIDFPELKNVKDKKIKNSIKSFETTLNTLADKFGTREEIMDAYGC